MYVGRYPDVKKPTFLSFSLSSSFPLYINDYLSLAHILSSLFSTLHLFFFSLRQFFFSLSYESDMFFSPLLSSLASELFILILLLLFTIINKININNISSCRFSWKYTLVYLIVNLCFWEILVFYSIWQLNGWVFIYFSLLQKSLELKALTLAFLSFISSLLLEVFSSTMYCVFLFPRMFNCSYFALEFISEGLVCEWLEE